MKKLVLLMSFLLICSLTFSACGANVEDFLGINSTNSIENTSQTSNVTNSTSVNNSTSSIRTSQSTVQSTSTENPISQIDEYNYLNSKAVVILMDRSSSFVDGEGSESFVSSTGMTRLEVMQEAFNEALTKGVFTEHDYVSIVYFGGYINTPLEVLTFTNGANLIRIRQTIQMDISILNSGNNYLGGNEFRHALEYSAKMLNNFTLANNKHILFITDGNIATGDAENSKLTNYPNGGWKYYGETLPTGYTQTTGIPEKCYTDYLYDTYQITTSTIDVASESELVSSYVASMATAKFADGTDQTCRVETVAETKDAVYNQLANIPLKPIEESKIPENLPEKGDYVIPESATLSSKLVMMQTYLLGEITVDNYILKTDVLVACEELYNNLTPSEKQSIVNYDLLVNARSQYNQAVKEGTKLLFVELVNSFPTQDLLKNKDVDNVYLAKALIDETENLLTDLTGYAEYKEKVISCYNKIQQSLVEEVFIAQDMNGNGVMEESVIIDGIERNEILGLKKRTDCSHSFFQINGSVSSGIKEDCHIYSDSKNSQVAIWQYVSFTNLTFNAPIAGTLYFYARPSSSREYNFALDNQNFAKLSLTSTSSGEQCIAVVPIVKAGQVSITTVSSSIGYCCAVRYVYPNLD